MTDTPDTTDDFPAFDEAAVRGDIEAYDPDRARGAPAAPRVMSAGPVMPFRLTMLSPQQAGDIPRRLAAIADPAERERAEGQMVEVVMRDLANAANVKRGHQNGTAYDREVAAISVEVLQLEAEAARNRDELNAVSRYETLFDPATGKPSPVPILRHAGAARARLEDRNAQIVRTILELEGPGGEHRLAKAANEELEKRREAHEDARVMHEADKLARKIVADERIAELAAARAKSLRRN